MLQALRSAEIITPDGPRPGALLLENDHIRGICNDHEIPSHALVHDLGTDALLPGLVDTHVHINEPGRTHWEGFRTATRAAAAGGFTTLVDMPLNCLPETTTVAALDLKRQAAHGQCHVDWLPWGGVVAGNQPHLGPLAHAGVPGFKCFLIDPGCEGFTTIHRADLEASLPTLAQLGLPLLVHAELAGPIDAATADLRAHNADWTLYATYLASRPDLAETAAIALLLALCRQYRFRLHIVHLSSALALPLLRHARAEGLPVTVETCPHYLVFAAEDIPTGNTLFKCAPPLRSRENCNQLWHALADGTIDLIATDHSPCPPALKHLDPTAPDHGRFDLAWGGIASLSLALSATWTEAARRGHTLTDIARWMSSAPAALAGLSARAGALAPGREATFTVFRSAEPWSPTPADLHTRHPISPFLGRPLLGRVQRTVLRGTTVFDRAAPDPFPGPPRGTDRSLPPAVS